MNNSNETTYVITRGDWEHPMRADLGAFCWDDEEFDLASFEYDNGIEEDEDNEWVDEVSEAYGSNIIENWNRYSNTCSTSRGLAPIYRLISESDLKEELEKMNPVENFDSEEERNEFVKETMEA